MTTANTAVYVPFREYRFLHVLCGLFLAVWILSAIQPVMVVDWWLENLLVFVLVALLAATYRWLPLSELSYLLIFIYLCMHEWGAHHRYATVPLGEWMRAMLHARRNDYDRIVHFAFGLLLAYPQFEALIRRGRVRRRLALRLPVAISLALGAGYEIIEAVVANVLSPETGEAFLALQGDPWDTQKDMFWALAGAGIAMGFTAVAMRATRATPVSATALPQTASRRAMAAVQRR